MSMFEFFNNDPAKQLETLRTRYAYTIQEINRLEAENPKNQGAIKLFKSKLKEIEMNILTTLSELSHTNN